MRNHKFFMSILTVILITFMTACGNTAETNSSDTDTASDNASSSEASEDLTLNLGGEEFLVTAPSSWSQITASGISNLDVLVNTTVSLPLESTTADDYLDSFAGVPIEDLQVTEFDGNTLYVGYDGDNIDVLMDYQGTDFVVFNVTVIGDADFATYQDEVTNILTTLRPTE